MAYVEETSRHSLEEMLNERLVADSLPDLLLDEHENEHVGRWGDECVLCYAVRMREAIYFLKDFKAGWVRPGMTADEAIQYAINMVDGE